MIGKVSSHPRQLVAPNVQKLVNGALSDLKGWQMRQEVVADEEDHKDPVINGQLLVKGEGNIGDVELDSKILAQDIDVKPDEWLGVHRHSLLDLVRVLHLLRLLAVDFNMSHLAAVATGLRSSVTLGEDILTQNAEVGLVSGEAKHDKIGVETVDRMRGVGVPRRVRALPPDPVDNLVLSLTGDRSVGDDNLELGTFSGQEGCIHSRPSIPDPCSSWSPPST